MTDFQHPAQAEYHGAHWDRVNRLRGESTARWMALARPASRERSERPQAGPSLEDVTLDLQWGASPVPDIEDGKAHPEQLTCKVVKYGDSVRASVCRARRPRVPHSGNEDEATGSSAPGEPLTAFQRSEASIRRSRALVVHRVRCLGAYALWTFTKRGKFANSDEVWATWKLLCQGAKWRYGAKFKYVAVPELHSDGETWHMHAVFPERFDVVSLRILWQRALGGRGNERGEHTKGNVDVKALRGRRTTARGIAGYISKYVGKGFERSGANRRVFAASCGLNPDRTCYWRCPWDAGMYEFTEFVGRRLLLDFGVERAFPRYNFNPKFQWALIDAPLRPPDERRT